MEIVMPDPHPGRCLNFRYFHQERMKKRCLDYEGHDGACAFETPKPRVESSRSYQFERRPEPWVSPLGSP